MGNGAAQVVFVDLSPQKVQEERYERYRQNEKPKVLTVNDKHQQKEYILKDQDVVKIFPIAMGG